MLISGWYNGEYYAADGVCIRAIAGKIDESKNYTYVPYVWRPGDPLCYSTGGLIGHVAICLGDGMLMHALNEKYGTLIQSMEYYESWD